MLLFTDGYGVLYITMYNTTYIIAIGSLSNKMSVSAMQRLTYNYSSAHAEILENGKHQRKYR